MKTQSDTTVRVVALENLKAMCREVSGTCHRYSVVKVSRSRVHVEYSNPNEYGSEDPVTVIYPCYPSTWQGDEDNPRVILDALRHVNSNGDDDAFYSLEHAPTMWRSSTGEREVWRTEQQILQERLGAKIETVWDSGGCMILGYDIVAPGRETQRAKTIVEILPILKAWDVANRTAEKAGK